MNLLIKNLVTATTIPEKPSITGIIYIVIYRFNNSVCNCD